MRTTLLFGLLVAFCLQLSAQKAFKGLEKLNEKDYPAGKEIFESALKADPNDVVANFGLSRYYSILRSGEMDNEQALVFLEKAHADFKNLDEKSKGKLTKGGLTSGDFTSQREKIIKAIYEDTKRENTIPAYEQFATRFPGTVHADDALRRRNEIAWQQTAAINTIEAINKFLEKYPDAYEAKAGRQKRNIMAADIALKTNTVAGFKHFVDNYPDAPQAAQMEQRLNASAWDDAQKLHTISAYEMYIRDYPNSIFLEKAKEKLRLLQEYGK